MKHLYLASIVLTDALVLAAVGVATATFGHGARPASDAAMLCGTNNSGQTISKPRPEKQAEAKSDPSVVRLTAQIPVATRCYTYAGSSCPLVNTVPARTPCKCYYPYGWSAGIAY